jgi:hypothetical protein
LPSLPARAASAAVEGAYPAERQTMSEWSWWRSHYSEAKCLFEG